MTEPTLGEVLRRLDEVSRQMTMVVTEMRQERVDNAKTYLRVDVYEARYSAGMERLKIVETEKGEKEKADDDFRRKLYLLIIGVALPAVLGLMLAINNFLASGGQTP